MATAEQKELMETISENTDKMNNWEYDFMTSVVEQEYDLTEKQAETLNNIFDKVTK